jgi:hypothetical protein
MFPFSILTEERRHYFTAMVGLWGSSSPTRVALFLGVVRAGLEKIGAELRFYNVEKSSFSGKTGIHARQN